MVSDVLYVVDFVIYSLYIYIRCNVTLMDFEGTKTTIQGRVGQTLLEACEVYMFSVYFPGILNFNR